VRLRREHVVLALTLALLGWMARGFGAGPGEKRGTARAASPELERHPAPGVAAALPDEPAAERRAPPRRELFAPPSDTRALPPLELAAPPASCARTRRRWKRPACSARPRRSSRTSRSRRPTAARAGRRRRSPRP
jgi:hypothetical protein